MVLGYFRRYSAVLVSSAFAVVATSGIFLYYYYLKRTRDNVNLLTGLELRRRRIDKLMELREKLEQLMNSLDLIDPEIPETEDDECIVCNSAKAIIQTYPCKHKVLCRRCFVKTLQVAVNDLNLPLKCVLCRTQISTLDRERHEGIGRGMIQQQNSTTL